METGIRILLLTALLAALPGCASVRDWFHQRAERRAEQRAAEAQRTEPRESEPPPDESAPPRVIEPEVSRRKITVPRIRTSNVELGLDYGALSIEDFGTNPVYGITAGYHITEDFFFQAEAGRSRGGRTSFETLGGNIQLLTESERRFTYYDLTRIQLSAGRGLHRSRHRHDERLLSPRRHRRHRFRRGYEVHGELWRRLPHRAGRLAGGARDRAGPRVPVEPARHHQAHQQPRGAHRYDRLLLEGHPMKNRIA